MAENLIKKGEFIFSDMNVKNYDLEWYSLIIELYTLIEFGRDSSP